MNKRQAEAWGYFFTGHYSHDKDEMKLRAAEERKRGNKAVVVDVPTDKLSRGYRGMGYSVYMIKSEKNIQKEARDAAVLKMLDAQCRVNEMLTMLNNAQAKAEIATKELNAFLKSENPNIA